MNNLFKSISLSSILISCTAQDTSIEDQLFTCIEQHYAENNIDLSSALDSVESYLVAQNILTSTDGAGKIKFYEDIVKNGAFPGIERIPIMDSLSKYYYGNDFVKQCILVRANMDSTQFQKTRYYQTSKAIGDDVIQQGGVSPVSVSKAFLKHMTKEDFELPIYRAHMLISFVMAADKNTAYIRNIPKKITEVPFYDFEGFTIELSASELSVNGEKIDIDEMQDSLLVYFNDFSKSTHVRFITQPKTRYGLFAEVQSAIEETYITFLNQIAQKEYNKTFSVLDNEEHEAIKARYPLRIVETVKK